MFSFVSVAYVFNEKVFVNYKISPCIMCINIKKKKKD